MPHPQPQRVHSSGGPYEVKTVRVKEREGFETTVMMVRFEEHEIDPLVDSGFYGKHTVFSIISPHGAKSDYKPRRLVRQHLGEPTPVLRKVCVGCHGYDDVWDALDDGDTITPDDLSRINSKVSVIDLQDL